MHSEVVVLAVAGSVTKKQYGQIRFDILRTGRKVQVMRLPGFATVGDILQDDSDQPLDHYLRDMLADDLGTNPNRVVAVIMPDDHWDELTCEGNDWNMYASPVVMPKLERVVSVDSNGMYWEHH